MSTPIPINPPNNEPIHKTPYDIQLYNTQFADNLRKNSIKIEQLLQQLSNLKNELNIKQRLIQQLKRKQSQIKIQSIQNQQISFFQLQSKWQLSNYKIEQLQNVNHILNTQIEQLKITINNLQNKKSNNIIQNAHLQQLQQLKRQINQKKQNIYKWKQKYQSCKQQCIFLHKQIQNQRNIRQQLELINVRTNKRHSMLIQQMEFKYNQLIKILEQNIECKQNLQNDKMNLQEHIKILSNQLTNQMGVNQMGMQQLVEKINDMQNCLDIWKNKYYELEATVNHCQGVRVALRYRKQLENKGQGTNFHQIGIHGKRGGDHY